MGRLLLSIKADLEGVTDLRPENDAFDFFFQTKCTNCYELHPKLTSMNRLEMWEVSGSKNNAANFVWRCGFCKRESSAKFDTTYAVKPYSIDSTGKFAPFLVVDCRGLEFTGFDPKGIWTCVGVESGTKFTEVNLEQEEEWVDYDEKASQPVSVMNVKGEWSRAS